MNNSHVIRQQVFELSFSSKEKSGELQNKISRFFNSYLADGMEQLFDRVIPENKVIRVDRLVITIPGIPYEWLDADFADAILSKLGSELQLLLLRDNSKADEKQADAGEDNITASLRLLTYFLLRGALPWWAGGENLADPVKALEFLLGNAAEALKALILNVGQRAYVRTRLVHQFSEQHIRAVVSILEPAEAEFIFDYHAEIINVQQEKQLIKNERSDFSKAVWVFILTYLLVDRGTYFNRKDFVKSNISRMSAHYNITYSELLSLLAEALNLEGPSGDDAVSLQAIIFELSVEDRKEIVAAAITPFQGDMLIENDLFQSRVSLLTYFLTFGSFPWWSSNVEQEELPGIFSGLVSRVPKTVERIIRRTGSYGFTRELIVRIFNEDTIRQIVKLIEPENADFIESYVTEVKTIHTKKPFVKAGSNELLKAVWLFVLEYLLVDRGSAFNRQMFLESNIRKLANRFNINYFELVVFMVQSISGSKQETSRHFSLFQGLIALYQAGESDGGQAGFSNSMDRRQEEIAAVARLNGIKAGVSLKNILYFWIRAGYLPWWAEGYAGMSPAALFEQLLAQSPGEAVTLLKYAGLQLSTRRRLAFQVTQPVLLKVFSLLPSGKEGLSWFDHLAALLKSSKRIKIRDHSLPGSILLFAFWDAFARSGYKQFLPGSFIRQAVVNLALWLGIPPEKLTASLLNSESPDTLTGVTGALFSSALEEAGSSWQAPGEINRLISDNYKNGPGIEKLQQEDKARTQHDVNENGAVGIIEKLRKSPEWMRGPDIEKLISGQISGRFAIKGTLGKTVPEKAEIVREALFILRFFLRSGKLPEEYKVFAELAVNYFLKELVLFLYREAAAALEEILRSEEYPGENFMRVHEIFALAATPEENRANKLLATHLEKNMLLYVRQLRRSAGAEKNLAQLVSRYLNGPASARTSQFLEALLKFPSVSSQLAHYYHDDAVYRLMSLHHNAAGWGTQTTPFLKAIQLWLAGLLPDRLDRDQVSLLFRTFHFMMIGRAVTAISQQEYLNLFFRFVFERQYQLMLKMAALAQKDLATSKLADPILLEAASGLKQELGPYIIQSKFKEELNRLLAGADKQSLTELGATFKRQQEKELKQLKEELQENKKEAEKEKQETEQDKDTIYINNAGLVLLHPFLPVYFNRLEMLEKGDFVSEEARYRAAHLLQYLVYGTEVNAEHELVLNKILCNIPLEEAIPAAIEVTEKERTVSAELLQAVLAQWDKLKNTSAGSLQTSFLQREGGLSRADEGWSLKVEQRGYDVLLQSLPWGLGMIKTSWMTEFIYVEWM